MEKLASLTAVYCSDDGSWYCDIALHEWQPKDGPVGKLLAKATTEIVASRELAVADGRKAIQQQWGDVRVVTLKDIV